MKIPHKYGLQEIVFNHSPDTEYHEFIEVYRKYPI